MEEEELKNIAAQLRKPSGVFAIAVGERMNEGNQLINLNIIDALCLSPNSRVMEIGMGNGFFVKNIFEKYPDILYYGCDYSPEITEQAILNNQELIEKNKVQFFNTANNSFPFEDGYFDTIFTVNTLYFWEDDNIMFREIKRLLKPKGKLILGIRPKELMQHYPFVKYGFRMFGKEDLQQLLTQNQFEISEIFERAEPEQDLNGVKIPLSSLIAIGVKNAE